MKALKRFLFAGLLLTSLHVGAVVALVEPPALDPTFKTKLAAWLKENGRTPIEYVTNLFSNHDVVFLGEFHRIRHDPLLVHSLLKPLYDSGVRTLAIEFGRREDQKLIDSLITAPEWNEKLGREIVFRFGVYWGYREYVDIYKAAWKLNHNLPAKSPRFRILGLNDSLDWSPVKSRADLDNPEIMSRVWKGADEWYWAQVITEAVRSGQKVLVYSGFHHAFTAYHQPIVINGAFIRFAYNRCGNYVSNVLGQQTITIYLHAPWDVGDESAYCHPADGVIDALMLAEGPRPVGFNLKGGPFGELRVKNGLYRYGYTDFKLEDFCDGWIYTKPISEYEGVTPIPGWINADNLATAQEQFPNPDFRSATADEINATIARDTDIHAQIGYLH